MRLFGAAEGAFFQSADSTKWIARRKTQVFLDANSGRLPKAGMEYAHCCTADGTSYNANEDALQLHGSGSRSKSTDMKARPEQASGSQSGDQRVEAAESSEQNDSHIK
jgi:hypothetical protein